MSAVTLDARAWTGDKKGEPEAAPMLNMLFLDHPAELGESYGEHMREASGYGFRLIAAGLACLVHAAVPALFRTKGSDTIRALNEKLVRKRSAKRDAHVEMRHGGWVI